MAAAEQKKDSGKGFQTLLRFLPMLWPRGETELKARVVGAVVLVLLARTATLGMPVA